MKSSHKTTALEIDQFDEIIDVRTPDEFAEDHIPGAINCPVLSNEERSQVGLAYHQQSAFEGKRIGAALIAQNIARYLTNEFAEKPSHWRPLIYCWRGGKRSGSMTYILRQIGWNAHILDGGYKNYRRHVVQQLQEIPASLKFRIITGPTGSAKTDILNALGKLGAQILDLEKLAAHKGSVLGQLPNHPQPSQKRFESLLHKELERLDPLHPIYVEAESKKIGQIQVPETLLMIMRQSPCLKIEATLEARIEFLQRDYRYMIEDQKQLKQQLQFLKEIVGKETLESWNEFIEQGLWSQLVTELLEKHYDRLYKRSQHSNYAGYANSTCYTTDDLSEAGIEQLAHQIIDEEKRLA